MMMEVPNVRQIPGEGRRRWFCDDYFDLIVWYEGAGITGFQLCYDRNGSPRAYTWTEADGSRHDGIDDGDDPLLSYKATPILIADGTFDVIEVMPRLIEAAKTLPPEIGRVVLERIDGEKRRAANNGVRDSRDPRRAEAS